MKWNFNPPVTVEELIFTAVARVESLLNSQALTYQSADPRDVVPLAQTISYMDSLVANLHPKPSTSQSSTHANDGENFSSKQVLWKKLLVCLSAVWVKTLINFLINVLLKNVIFFDYVFHAFAQTFHQPV